MNKIKLIIFSLFILTSNGFANIRHHSTYNYQIIRVIDGDTIEFAVNFLPKSLKPSLSLRLSGIDTPDINAHAKCPEENKLGQKAKEFTTDFINNSQSIYIDIIKCDKYGGRVDGDIIGDRKSLRRALLKNHLAIPYKGDKKPNWCNIK